MLNKDQHQEVESNSTAIQAARDVSITIGVSAAEARSIALDVAKLTFYELSGTARDIASMRVEEITEQVIAKLEADFPEGLQKAKDPDFQYALFTVQKQYARSGDKNLGDLLVDLLVDRSKQSDRDLLQIVLNESLETAPKLTDAQLSNLALIFLLRYTQDQFVGSDQMLGSYFDEKILPFSTNLTTSNASFQHLEFAGCGSSQITEITLEDIFSTTFRGLFSKGFDESEIHNLSISTTLSTHFITRCVNDLNRFQIKAINKDFLETFFDIHKVEKEDRRKITGLFDTGKMNKTEIRQKCIRLRPYMDTVFEKWNNSSMKSFTLTSVGIAIGHANIKRIAGRFSNLSIWIN